MIANCAVPTRARGLKSYKPLAVALIAKTAIELIVDRLVRRCAHRPASGPTRSIRLAPPRRRGGHAGGHVLRPKFCASGELVRGASQKSVSCARVSLTSASTLQWPSQHYGFAAIQHRMASTRRNRTRRQKYAMAHRTNGFVLAVGIVCQKKLTTSPCSTGLS